MSLVCTCANYEMTVHHEKVIKALRHTTLQWLEFRSNYQKKVKVVAHRLYYYFKDKTGINFPHTRHQITQGKFKVELVARRL
jgi:hypothetical protein